MFELIKVEARKEGGFTRSVLILSALSAGFSLLLRMTSGLWSTLPLADILPHVAFAYLLYAGIVTAAQRGIRLDAEIIVPAAAGTAMGLCLPGHTALGVFLFGAILGTAIPARPVSPARRFATGLLLALSCLAGSIVFGAIESLVTLGGVSQVLMYSAVGGVFGVYVSLAAIPEHLSFVSDPVRKAYEQARLELTGKLLDNAARCWAVYRRILDSIDAEVFGDEREFAEFKENLSGILLSTFDLSLRWQEVEAYLARVNSDDLAQRIADNRKKAGATDDQVAREQYLKIEKSLEQRLTEYKKLGQAKERVMSRLEYYFTVLEDLHLSTVRLKSSTAQADSMACNSLFERMEDLSKDLKATSLTLEEFDVKRFEDLPAA